MRLQAKTAVSKLERTHFHLCRRLLKEACRAAEEADREVCEELASLLAGALTQTANQVLVLQG